MMVLRNECKKCEKCNYRCNVMYFQQNFNFWTSGNDDLDKFIKDTQLSAHSKYGILDALEWIPYNHFYNIKFAKNIGMYKANWIDGKIYYWDNFNQNWRRISQKMIVILEILNDPKKVTLEFIKKV
jgi:hypothetical protein